MGPLAPQQRRGLPEAGQLGPPDRGERPLERTRPPCPDLDDDKKRALASQDIDLEATEAQVLPLDGEPARLVVIGGDLFGPSAGTSSFRAQLAEMLSVTPQLPEVSQALSVADCWQSLGA